MEVICSFLQSTGWTKVIEVNMMLYSFHYFYVAIVTYILALQVSFRYGLFVVSNARLVPIVTDVAIFLCRLLL